MSSRFVRFLIAGGSSAVINLASRVLLNNFMSFEAAVIVAYLVGIVTAYTFSKIFVFEETGYGLATEFRRFFAVNMMSLAIVWVISVGLVVYVFPAITFRWHAELVAHFIGLSATSVVSYFAHKHYTFRAVSRTPLPPTLTSPETR